MRFVMLALLFCLAAPATAQARILPPEKAKGINTIITQCVSFTRASFANAACDDLLIRIDPIIRAEGLTHIALGRTEWGFGRDVYLTTENPPPNAAHLTPYVRGADSPTAMFVWLSFYNQTPSGRLML